MGDMDDIVKEFLVESYENLDQLDRDFVALEQNPDAREQLASIFRTIHTIKGTCGFLGFHKLESVTHVGENLLSKLRDGLFAFDSETASALLAMVDAVRQILGAVEQTGGEGDGDYTNVVRTLTALNDAKGPGAKAAAPKKLAAAAGKATTAATAVAAVPVAGAAADVADLPDALAALEAIQAEIDRAAAVVAPPGQAEIDHVVAALKTGAGAPPPPPAAPQSDAVADEAHAFAAAPAAAEDAHDVHAAAPAAGDADPAKNASNSSIRVDVTLLDKLMNLVGELVLARNQVLQFTTSAEDGGLQGTSQRLNLITTELQEGVMKTRMQPIGTIWNKFPRVVRDLAKQCGKKIRLEMEGRETDLDKTIIEAIKDPLTHVIRNSCDHGVETPERRRAAGKPEEGRITMRAFHEGGQVNIEIADDGGGIPAEKVKAKAVQKGLITAEQAARMTEREAINLIFLPGFSTAEQVTNVSGRGVGMDVVKTNIEKIGGTVDVATKPGEGTTLRVRIPLTLAIIPALIISSGGDRFAIPQVSLLELVRLEPEIAATAIEHIGGAPVYRLRGRLLPLVYLNAELGTARRGNVAGDGTERDQAADAATNIVVLQADGRPFGLVVDEINDTEEIVVKPLGKQLKQLSVFAGATIMGDGRVALILDVTGVAGRASVLSDHAKDARDAASDSAGAAGDDAADRQTLLLFRVGPSRRMAIPLGAVARLEEFAASTIETDGQGDVVQYRGRIMPLVRLASVLAERPATPGAHAAAAAAAVDGGRDAIQVVVHTAPDGRSVGLVVDRILDIVQQSLTVTRAAARPGIRGSAVIGEKVTELVDIDGVAAMTGAAA